MNSNERNNIKFFSKLPSSALKRSSSNDGMHSSRKLELGLEVNWEDARMDDLYGEFHLLSKINIFLTCYNPNFFSISINYRS